LGGLVVNPNFFISNDRDCEIAVADVSIPILGHATSLTAWLVKPVILVECLPRNTRNMSASLSALAAGCPDQSARRQGGLELIVGNSELDFPAFPPFCPANLFIIHLLVLLHVVYRLIYMKINEINK
jgi:hypothetical protein